MTCIKIKDEVNNNCINITQMELGKWYRIVEYRHNSAIVGEVGVAVYFKDKALVTPCGSQYSNEDIQVELINKVTVTIG